MGFRADGVKRLMDQRMVQASAALCLSTLECL